MEIDNIYWKSFVIFLFQMAKHIWKAQRKCIPSNSLSYHLHTPWRVFKCTAPLFLLVRVRNVFAIWPSLHKTMFHGWNHTIMLTARNSLHMHSGTLVSWVSARVFKCPYFRHHNLSLGKRKQPNNTFSPASHMHRRVLAVYTIVFAMLFANKTKNAAQGARMGDECFIYTVFFSRSSSLGAAPAKSSYAKVRYLKGPQL